MIVGDEGVDALTVTAVLTSFTASTALTTVLRIRLRITTTVGATSLPLGTGFIRRTATLAVDTLQPPTGVSTGATVLRIGHQILALVPLRILGVRATTEPFLTGRR